MHVCSEHGCKANGTWCVWSPLFRDADTGPRWLCDRHGIPHRPRAMRQGWYIGPEALANFQNAVVVSREHNEILYQATLMPAFRHGSHIAGVPLGSMLAPTQTAIYALRGVCWVFTDRFAIGLKGRDHMDRLQIPKLKIATGLTRAVACN